MNRLVVTWVTTLLLFGSNFLSAEEQENLEQDSSSGIVDYVSLTERKVVVNDQTYLLALDLVVSGDNVSNTEFALKEGRKVRILIDPKTEGKQVKTIKQLTFIDR